MALDLSNYCANNCIDTRFALLHVSPIRPKLEPEIIFKPKPRRKSGLSSFIGEEEDDDDDQNGENLAACYLMSKDRRDNPFEYSVTLSSLVDVAPERSMFKSERPLPRTDRIVCFKNYRALRAR